MNNFAGKILVVSILLILVLGVAGVIAEKGGNSADSGSPSGSSGSSSGSGSDKKGSSDTSSSTASSNEVKTTGQAGGKESKPAKSSEEKVEQEVKSGEVKVKVSSSKGLDKINVTPELAYSAAVDALGSKNISFELKELDSKGNKVVYEVTANKTGTLLGILKIKTNVKAQIDAETGEVVSIQKKWWHFLVAGEDKDETGDSKVFVCHKPGKIGSTLSISRSALKAHLAHGDYEGACGGVVNNTNGTVPPINNTNSTIPPINNTNSTIPPLNDTNSTIPPLNNTNSTVPINQTGNLTNSSA